MSIDLKQTDGGNVKPIDDARLYNFILSGKSGIVEGIQVTHLGANQLKVSAGWGVCCGRMFIVEEETINAAVSLDGKIKGRLIISIDVSADIPASFITQAAAALPALVQEDINSSGIVYQLPVAEYAVDELAVSEITDTAPRFIISISNADTAQNVRGLWFAFEDAEGNPTEELYAHWYEDEETGKVVMATPIS